MRKSMHTFQTMPIKLLEFNPFTKIGKDLALVTVGSKDSANPMTIGWGGVGVIWGKNAAFVFIRDSRYTKELIDKYEFFSITFMGEQYKDALDYCGSHSGRNENKIDNACLTLAARHGIPYIDEGNFVLLCKKMAATKLTQEDFFSLSIQHKWYEDGDYHTMYIAEIIEVLAR